MFHVFYVHSQTCYVAVLKIIEFEQLDRSKVVVLVARNTPIIDGRLKHVFIKPVLDEWKFYALRDIWDMRWLHTRRVIDLFDSIIETYVNGKFVFYSQNGRHYKYNVIVSSPLCIGNNYFEDGLDNYSSQDEFHIKYPSPIKNRYLLANFVLGSFQGIRSRVRQYRDPFWDGENESVFYGLHPLSMDKIPLNIPKIILSDISVNIDLPDLSNIPIVLPSALDEQNISKNEANVRVYIDYLGYLKIVSVYIKWHPAHKESTKSFYRNEFRKSGVQLIELDPSIPMELYFAKKESSHFILSIGSSLVLYGALFNSKNTSVVLYNELHRLIGNKTPRSKYWEKTFSLFNLDNLKIIN